MKFIISTLVLPLLAAAAPTPKEDATTSPPFTVMALRSGSPIHFLTMTASDEHFWLGGNTASYCPSEEGIVCPPGKETVLAENGNAMDVEVPGGQQVYVGPAGALRYTQAHSASMPKGSTVGGMHYQAGKPYASVTFEGRGASGLMACPTKNHARWQVFAALQDAKVPTGNVDDCLGFDTVAETYKGKVPAWQYT
ncbi:hypothetical protein N7474_006030 [Penicillium riverlandense]|uniref:uncharacterized protein n=1 Tax=Penicillium riverlandense TaxID=1903569 RepID=UPI002548C8FD|nr:uncharacterized protein N7474_006030 [Penicillium riverlandense]KAJ5820439.1 hypothetical protein N7474_006030 [Penicillium riverlandense]